MDSKSFEISSDYMPLTAIRKACRAGSTLTLSPATWSAIKAGAAYADLLSLGNASVYGVNTGFGALCHQQVGTDDISRLQHNHLRSHACGVGEDAPAPIVRAMIVLKLMSFRTGHSGVGVEVVKRLLDFLAADLLPVVPMRGSVGASGDLAPLAHLALPLIGEGLFRHGGIRCSTSKMLTEHGWYPLILRAKEGLALTNGVQFLNACALHILERAERMLSCADLICALSIQGFAAADTFFNHRLKAITTHPERWDVMDNLTKLLAGGNHAGLDRCDPLKEDPYSFRCAPQVHAAARQAFAFVAQIVERDCNSVSDNPLLFPDENLFLTNGSMHGQTTAMALDVLAIGLADLMSISERRIYQLLSGQHGLPSFLATCPGVDSGLMVWQYTAAALVNESKVLATPSSVDTIMTCHLQEDHVSMGSTGALKALRIISNLEMVLAIELVTACAAIDVDPSLRLSPATAPVYQSVRDRISPLNGDRSMNEDMAAANNLLINGEIITATLSQLAAPSTRISPSSRRT
ncbi:MAG: histidine ammonia-lyase [Myxacorys chilensis ATA2-1-KO14]|jgi:histidine ammonia-lyase|nr:histidine ammonia-lyase [Myxacorys chilensis ATA2-1-KO14]